MRFEKIIKDEELQQNIKFFKQIEVLFGQKELEENKSVKRAIDLNNQLFTSIIDLFSASSF